MKIILRPEDLVKLGVWDSFTYYIVGDEKKAEEILIENSEFELSNRDALVIGLLKVIETPNLIHRFNTYLADFLNIKSQREGKSLLVRKKGLIFSIEKFLNKYPNYWNPTPEYKKGLQELEIYLDNLKNELEKLEIQKITDQFGTHDFINSSNVKKLLNFSY
jgi:hypothetical protein